MKHARLALVLLLLASPGSAQTIIHVPGNAPTIQGGIDQAQPGDSVLVAPGTYFEAINYRGKAVSVVSEAGAATTIISATPNTLPCVSFHEGEGPAALLRGFTVTGSRNSSAEIFGGGISCLDLRIGLVGSPTIQECMITGNVSGCGCGPVGASGGGGVYGDAIIEDCTISGNSVGFAAAGGGVHGTPVMRRCLVSGNISNGEGGGGIYIDRPGAIIEDSIIVNNTANEYPLGGGIWVKGTGARIRRCLIAQNVGNTPFGTGGGVGAGIFSEAISTRVERCTVAGNRVGSSGGTSYGGMQGFGSLVNCVVWGNDATQLAPALLVTYSDVQGGFPGTGNIDADPMFADPANLDYRLMSGSPCIDAGDASSSLDPDCTRADMGAFYFPQANTVLRNGAGSNRVCFTSLSEPGIGATWTVRLVALGHPGATFSGFVAYGSPLVPGLQSRFGELLVNPSSGKLAARTVASNGVADDIAVAIPNDPTLIGRIGYVQGFIAGGGIELCNALDVKIGN
jgi:hypothetical protein